MSEQREPTYDKTTHTGIGTDNKIEPKPKASGNPTHEDSGSASDANKELVIDNKKPS
jgi:hypothetical protein